MIDDDSFEARVTQYNIARVRLGQMLLPVAMVTAVAARRFPSAFTAVLTFGVQALIVWIFITGVKRLEWHRLVFQRGGLSIGSTQIRIERFNIIPWTMLGGLARIYGSAKSYKLRPRSGAEADLSAFLSRFGPPTILHRRGSFAPA